MKFMQDQATKGISVFRAYLDFCDIAFESFWEDEVVILHSVGHVVIRIVELQQPLMHPSGAAAFAVTQTSYSVRFSVDQPADADAGHPVAQP